MIFRLPAALLVVFLMPVTAALAEQGYPGLIGGDIGPVKKPVYSESKRYSTIHQGMEAWRADVLTQHYAQREQKQQEIRNIYGSADRIAPVSRPRDVISAPRSKGDSRDIVVSTPERGMTTSPVSGGDRGFVVTPIGRDTPTTSPVTGGDRGFISGGSLYDRPTTSPVTGPARRVERPQSARDAIGKTTSAKTVKSKVAAPKPAVHHQPSSMSIVVE